jgi:hypothetical protein
MDSESSDSNEMTLEEEWNALMRKDEWNDSV